MTTVVVFGGRMSESDRRSLEDGFVGALSTHGVHATPSYLLFPGSVPSEPAAEENVQKGGYDGVLVSTMQTMHTAPEVPSDAAVEFETKLWDPSEGGKMIWSNVTATGHSPSAYGVDALLSHVIPAMIRAGVLPASPNATVD
jgi:hypothetical protein